MTDLIFVDQVAPYRDADGQVSVAGVHQSLGSAGRALELLATMHGLRYRRVSHVSELGLNTISQAGVLALYTIGETPWSAPQRKFIETQVHSGELSLLGLHSATDSSSGWDQFGRLMGARFDGHPVTGELPIVVLDAAHPSTAHLPSPWYFLEELYLFSHLAPDARLLLGVDTSALEADARERLAQHRDGNVPEVLPLCWCIERGPLRTFYTVLGHFVGAYEDPRFMQHIFGAIGWLIVGQPGLPTAALPGEETVG